MDFTFEYHGTICLLRPHTEAAAAWIAEHISGDAFTFGHGVVVEPRFAGDLIEGLLEDGLSIGGDIRIH